MQIHTSHTQINKWIHPGIAGRIFPSSRGKVCTWEGDEISSPFTPAPSKVLIPIQTLPPSASCCWGPALEVGVEKTSLSIMFSGRASPNNFLEDALLQSSVGGSPLFVWDGTSRPKFHRYATAQGIATHPKRHWPVLNTVQGAVARLIKATANLGSWRGISRSSQTTHFREQVNVKRDDKGILENNRGIFCSFCLITQKKGQTHKKNGI